MTDDEIERHIGELVAAEHELERTHLGVGLDEADRARLDRMGTQLDRYWDLLRQRRARREAGLDPEGAAERSEGVVEGYQQ